MSPDTDMSGMRDYCTNSHELEANETQRSDTLLVSTRVLSCSEPVLPMYRGVTRSTVSLLQ